MKSKYLVTATIVALFGTVSQSAHAVSSPSDDLVLHIANQIGSSATTYAAAGSAILSYGQQYYPDSPASVGSSWDNVNRAWSACASSWTGSFSVEILTSKINNSGDAWNQCMARELWNVELVAQQQAKVEVTQINRLVIDRVAFILRPPTFAQSLKGGEPGGGGLDRGGMPGDKKEKIDTDKVGTGTSGGDGEALNGIWGNLNYVTNTDKSVSRDKKDTSNITGMIGYDRKFTAHILAGATFGYSNSVLKSPTLRVETDGLALTAYGAYRINDNLNVYTLVGHTWQDADRGVSDSKRIMGSLGVNLYKPVGDYLLSGRVNHMLSQEKEDATGKKRNFDQFSISSEVSRPITTDIGVVEPYAGLGLEIDTQHHDIAGVPYDPNGFVASIGSRLGLSNQLSSELQVMTLLGRQNISEYSFMGNIRFTF
ncbi:MAG: autotransporter outer membrane beta-barrel domain-containing protein [Magnetococcales bacterium]|nr:autotransporter outer membrane beta-barrel domain-containing protein [Magnetococcales bacterium]MBF0322866.1 autotransporter outer membrane beta-barrel domain-containing protein [Magnetococcales bacterium]